MSLEFAMVFIKKVIQGSVIKFTPSKSEIIIPECRSISDAHQLIELVKCICTLWNIIQHQKGSIDSCYNIFKQRKHCAVKKPSHKTGEMVQD